MITGNRGDVTTADALTLIVPSRAIICSADAAKCRRLPRWSIEFVDSSGGGSGRAGSTAAAILTIHVAAGYACPLHFNVSCDGFKRRRWSPTEVHS